MNLLSHSILTALLVWPAMAQQLAPPGTLRATFLGTNPVQARVDSKTGAVSGPAEELTRELARRLGVPFTITPRPISLPIAGGEASFRASDRIMVSLLARRSRHLRMVQGHVEQPGASGLMHADQRGRRYAPAVGLYNPGELACGFEGIG
jgi:hypothetical protein